MELDYSMDYTAYLLSEDNGLNEESPQEEVPKLRGQNLIDDFLKRDEKETVEEAVPSATDTKLDAMPEQPDDAAESVEECSSSQSSMLEATAEQPIEGACQIIGADEPSETADQQPVMIWIMKSRMRRIWMIFTAKKSWMTAVLPKLWQKYTSNSTDMIKLLKLLKN